MPHEPFEWRIEESRESRTVQGEPAPRRYIYWVLVALATVAAAVWLWGGLARQLDQEQIALRNFIQRQADLQHNAFLAGDGELFFDSFTNNPAHRAAQLWPINREAWRAGYTITHVEQLGQSVAVASAEWTAAGQSTPSQRLLFYEQTPFGLRQRPSPTAFWGEPRTAVYPWGNLVLYEVDEIWQADFARQIASTADFLCATACPPLNVIIAPDFGDTAAPQTILYPSPRLIALDETGEPATLYWQLFLAQLKAYYAPAPIRFGVPTAQLAAYQEMADRYTAANPSHAITLVPLESLPPAPADWVRLVDGAAVAPTVSLIAQGLIWDVTAYAQSDPLFAPADFYEQIWLASWWQGRMWFVPQTAEMSLVYYDPVVYRQLGWAKPAAGWAEWAEQAAVLSASGVRWGAADPSRDWLFSFAYSQLGACPAGYTVRCPLILRPSEVTAALSFYAQMAPLMPDMAPLNPVERENLLLTLTSPSSNGVALWHNKPVEYENHSQQRSAQVAPLPGVTPLWVQGSFISASSEQPRVVWEWLRFVSHQYPSRTGRLVPSRPSVAQRVSFWGNLPAPLEVAMSAAFPFARPVLLDEQDYFGPAQLVAVRDGRPSPPLPRLRWFGE